MTTEQQKSELITLLAQRGIAGQAAWTRIWELVHQTLGRMSYSIYRNIREEREDLLANFFSEKLLEGDAQFKSFAMLITSYRNYLTDVYRREKHRPLAEDLAPHAYDGDHSPGLADLLVADEDTETLVGRKKLAASARTFLTALDDIGRLFISEGFCDHEGEALYKLAKRHQIASYHKKAADLGILQNKTALGVDYGKTRIGRWLTQTLGVTIHADYLGEIRDALEVLCEQAQEWLCRMPSQKV